MFSRDLLVVAVQIAEYRLQPDHSLAIERHIHSENSVRRRVMRPHRHFKQFAFAIRLNHRGTIPAFLPGSAQPNVVAETSLAPLLPARNGTQPHFDARVSWRSTSSCAVGSYSKSSGST